MIELIFLFLIFAGVYGYALKFWKKNKFRFSINNSFKVKYFHYSTFLLLIILGMFGLTLRGIWTNRIIIILCLISGIFFNLFSQKSVLNKFEKIYFNFLSFFPILFFGLVLIPMIGFIVVISLIGQLFNPVNEIYYEDDKLRIQNSFIGVMAPPKVKIFNKNGIFENEIIDTDFFVEDIDSVKVEYKKDSVKLYIWNEYNDTPKEPEVFLININKTTGNIGYK